MSLVTGPGATRTLVSDMLTPLRVYRALRAADPDGGSFLLERVVGDRWARFAIAGYRPKYEALLLPSYEAEGTGATWALRASTGAPPGWRPPSNALLDVVDPIEAVAPLFARDPTEAPRGDLIAKALAHWAKARVGYVAWDLVHAITKVPPPNTEAWRAAAAPLARFMFGSTIVLFDSLAQTMTIAGETEEDVERAVRDISNGTAAGELEVPDRRTLPPELEVEIDDATYGARVERAKEYIRAGDAFQVVLARRFSAPRAGRDPLDVFRALRIVNPAPYLYFLDLSPAPGDTERVQLAGCSPETLVRLEKDTMVVRPIAGTRPRGRTRAEDDALADELLGDAKERAEHVMLVDLGRNDVGRVAETGSVHVTKLMKVERYSHVMHIVSDVRGVVSPTVPPLEVVRAAFPAGTLSGAPKVRAMQIISELEGRPRGIYGGAIGQVGTSGNLDFAIAIRTVVAKGDRLEVMAGAGIVEASVPQAEADETRNKALALLYSIGAVPAGRAG